MRDRLLVDFRSQDGPDIRLDQIRAFLTAQGDFLVSQHSSMFPVDHDANARMAGVEQTRPDCMKINHR